MKTSEDDLREILKPIFPILEQIIRDGFRFYVDSYRDFAFKHSPRTRASTINDHIVDLAMQRLPAFGIRSARLMQRSLFEFKGECLLHFKKLNRRKLTANYPTLFALDFNKQLDLPGLPSTLPRLVAGYVPTPDWSGVESVYVTCPNGDDVEWFIDLSRENLIAASAAQTTAISHTSTNVEPRIRKRQRIKRDDDSGNRDAAES